MNNIVRQPYTFDRVIRILITICVIIAILYFLNLLKGVLLPFLVAGLIAYILEPAVKLNQRLLRTNGRLIPIVLTLLEICIIISLVGYLLIPHLIKEASQMAILLHKYATTQINTPFISDNIHSFIRDNIDFQKLSKLLNHKELLSIIKNAVVSSWGVVTSSINILIQIVSWSIAFLYLFFIMLDYERLKKGFKQLVPPRYRKRTFRIIDDVKDAMNQYFRGQFLIASTVGVLFAIGFSIVGLPLGIILGLFIGILNMVPYLQIVSFPITAFLCLVYSVDTGVDFWIITCECVAVYVIVQIIQDMILTPKIMGKAMGLNPAIILLSLSIWGSLLGFMGMIIALPLTTLVLSYYNRYVVRNPHMQQKAFHRHSKSFLSKSRKKKNNSSHRSTFE